MDLPLDAAAPAAPTTAAPTATKPVALVVKPISRRFDDCAILKGASALSGALNPAFSSTGDATMWMNVFEFYRNEANAAADSLESQVLPALKNSANKSDLSAVISQIRSADQSGNGDADYWASEFNSQGSTYGAAAQQLLSLEATACRK